MTDSTVSVPEDIPEGGKRRSIENEVKLRLAKREEEARFNNHLRDLYNSVSKHTGKRLGSTDDLIYALARFASRGLKEHLIGQPGTVYPWQKPKP